MQDSVKYLIHADITTSGVVERSDVVGAVFGQTEGLLGDDLDLRDLQESSKIGRIDVQITSEGGRSFGEITIGSRLDRVETAILAAALETIERVGPCRADVEVTELEDVRSAKRKEVVERAKELLADFEASSRDTQDIVEEVRESIRVEDITEFRGLPAGPRVEDSDAIVVVEGRADVLTLLRYGIKNAIAVEGTDVPDDVAELTEERTVTTFLDGDRGGDLILKELAQVGDVDYVALAPDGQSVEDLSRGQVMDALRQKVPYEVVADADDPTDAIAATDGSARPAPPGAGDASGDAASKPSGEGEAQSPGASDEATGGDASENDDPSASSVDETDATSSPGVEGDADGQEGAKGDADGQAGEETNAESVSESEPEGGERADESEGGEQVETLAGHVHAVADTGRVRLLDEDFEVVRECSADDAFDALVDADDPPAAIVLDGVLDQRLLDVAAQRGVQQVVASEEGDFVKKPTSVRIRTIADF